MAGRSPVLPLGKESIAVVAGQVWVGGYGSGGTPRLYRLDPDTLRPVGGSPVDKRLGPGAILWPGRSVLWVRAGGDTSLYCVDPSDGRVLQRWRSVQGPVASVPGAALAVGAQYAAGNRYVGHTSVSRLSLNAGCTG